MNFQLVVAFLLLLCHEAKQMLQSTSDIRSGTKTNATIVKAFLMQCSDNFDSPVNIHVTVQIAINDSFVGKILLGDFTDSNRNFACDLKAPSLVDVSNEDFALMYPFKLQTTLQTKTDITDLNEGIKEACSVIKSVNDNCAKTKINLIDSGIDKDVHTANNVKLLDGIYYTRLKPSDFLKRSDFIHTNPKDFRRDSICTKNFRKDNNKNNANNEYANEEFYGDKNQRENENAFSGKLEMNLNNNEIDNIVKSNKKKKNTIDYNILNDIGYFTKNLFDDKDSWKRRKKIKEHKSDFVKCVGMKNFKKIDHVLCTCARNVDEVNADETENNDEQSDCFQLINNVCLWGPVYNKNINYEMKMNEDIRNVNYGNIKSTASACYDEVHNQWLQITESKLLDELLEIIKNESDDVMDQRTSRENGKITENKIHRSESLPLKKYDSYSRNSERFKNKQMRLINIETVPLHETPGDIVKILNKPLRQRNFHKKETKAIDQVIYDPHLNIADKMQLINAINPKRPCERNRMNHQLSFHDRHKRHFDRTDQSLTDDELDSALEDYDFPVPERQDDLKTRDYSEINDSKKSTINKNVQSMNHNESLRKVQKICSKHLCALAMSFKKDPYFRGEIKFLDNNGSSLNSIQMAENICHDHFHEFVLIPYEYANGEK